MKIFTLKSKGAKPDLIFNLGDLVPLPQKRVYGFKALSAFIDFRDYFADTGFSGEDYKNLYTIPGNWRSDFFMVRDSGVIVIPGKALFPTLLQQH